MRYLWIDCSTRLRKGWLHLRPARAPYCVPSWGWREHGSFFACLLTGRVVHGPHVAQLLKQLRELTGTKYAFGFNSGQDAIRAVLLASGIGPDDHVILPSYCCDSVGAAVASCPATLIYCDVGRDLNPDIDHLLSLLSPEVKAIIFTHLFGIPGAIDELEDRLRRMGVRNRVLLIDDAAQSFGARIGTRYIGTFGDAGILSFGPGKTMSATGGGVVISNSAELAAKLHRNTVDSPDAKKKLKKALYWLIFRRWRRYTIGLLPFAKRVFAGTEDRGRNPLALCNIDAAIARVQLKKLDQMLEIRRRRKTELDRRIAELSGHQVSQAEEIGNVAPRVNAVTKYPLFLNEGEADEETLVRYMAYMNERGVEILPLYEPIHLRRPSPLPTALKYTEEIWTRIIQVPVEPSIGNRDFARILTYFERFWRRETARRSRDRDSKRAYCD